MTLQVYYAICRYLRHRWPIAVHVYAGCPNGVVSSTADHWSTVVHIRTLMLPDPRIFLPAVDSPAVQWQVLGVLLARFFLDNRLENLELRGRT